MNFNCEHKKQRIMKTLKGKIPCQIFVAQGFH